MLAQAHSWADTPHAGTDIVVKWEKRLQSFSDTTLRQLEECATKNNTRNENDPFSW
jgi:hypothetical protein